MNHRVKTKQFNRDTNHRKSMLRNLVRSLIEVGSVTTTTTKAKELRRLSDKLIHKAQQNTLASRQILHRFFGKRDVVNTLVETIAPAITDRVSGFTTLVKIGNRKGDNGQMSKVTLIKQPSHLGSLKAPKTEVVAPKKATTKAAPKKVVPAKAKAEVKKN
jgi:large subunit ribosomal protein L17